MKTITNKFKLTLATLGLLVIGTANAQQETGDVTTNNKNIQTGLNKTVRVIDNKGTIKYLQSKNGITMITNTTTDQTTTTWQLGGTLTDNTYIDASGAIFALDGIALETGAASTNAVDGEVAKGGTATGTGYTFLVRDEATGETKKILAADVVQNGHSVFTATVGQTAYDLSALVPAPNLTSYQKVWVYRNGAKLVANLDYTVAGSTVTLVPSTTAPNDWSVYDGDVIEVQFNY
ncbi:hypothetical protein [Tenacibaculum mesophilum]|uniref:hypothetical protein n=1 Tax=Tenacibaculum mesophilum TaxID=104268 RepID=UPI0024928D18|nr:hypothetical protein [Tenacibaculum mesophilum]